MIACLFGGCRSATVPDSVLPLHGGNDPQVQLDYWHELATKRLVSNDEAFHGLLLYLDETDNAGSYPHRVTALKSRGLLPRGFNRPADEALERGTLAVAVAKILNIKGGVTMRLLGGTSPRYAMRELEYRDILPPSSTNQIFTGSEFVGVIGKVQDTRAGDPANLPAAVMPAQTHAKADRIPTAGDLALAAIHLDDAEPESDAAAVVKPVYAMILAPEDLTLQPPATAPSTAPTTTSTATKIIVTAVEGSASVREGETAAWKPAVKGMQLTENAEFRTGPRGTIQFVIPPDQTVSVDRLTTLKVLRVIREGGKATTDLGIKYGRTRYDLEGGGLEHQSTLRSPNATLAVRGTKVSLFDQRPYPPQAISLTGRAEFQAIRRKRLAFGNPGQGRTVVTSESESPGQVALAETIIDPTLGETARTAAEAPLIATVISTGATVDIDRTSGIKIVRGGIPPADAQLVPALPGRLNFVLRWDGDANLDLGVGTPPTAKFPGGEFVYPAAGLNIAPSGGTTAFDHRGGPHGGIEVVYFDNFSTGVYGVSGPSLTTGKTVTATLEAFLDGQPLNLFDGLSLTKTVTQSVAPGSPALALVGVGTDIPIPMFSIRPAAAKMTTAATFKQAATLTPQGPVPFRGAAAAPVDPRRKK